MDKRLTIAYFYYLFEGIDLEKKRQSMNSKVRQRNTHMDKGFMLGSFSSDGF